MHEDQEFLALSRTFRIIDGVSWEAVEAAQPAIAGAGLNAGQVIDSKYRIDQLLGQGGMGSVYRAQHLLLNKTVALKTFRAESMTADAWERFQREAQSIARLTHVNIVQVFDFGIGPGNVPYYTMELLSGQSLADRLKEIGRMELSEALPIFGAVAGALGHAHKVGIVHRDIKPANIFLDRDKAGRVVPKVVDFGIAKLATSHAEIDRGGQSQTDSDLVFGSPLYMSPEQAMGKPTDHRTDIYSFGCTIYEALTGKPPFHGKNAFDTIRMHTDKKAPYLVESAGGVTFSRDAEALVARLLAKDVDARYGDFADVVNDMHVVASAPISSANAEAGPIARVEAKLAQEGALEFQSDNRKRPSAHGGSFNFVMLAAIVVLLAGVAAVTIYVQKPARGVDDASAAIPAVPPTMPPNNATKAAPIEKAASEFKPVTGTPNYFSRLTPGGGRIFYWPINELVGEIFINGEPAKPARGIMTIPPGCSVTFIAGEPMQIDPQLFSRFRPDDINRVNFNSNLTWGNRHVDAATQYMPGLSCIELPEADVDGAIIDYCNRLEKLDALDVSSTKVTGEDLCRLKRLTSLSSFHASGISNVAKPLAQLKNSKTLLNLTLNEDNLTDADMAVIGTMKNLILLYLRDNAITPEGLQSLGTMPHLRNLGLNSKLLGPQSLKKFPTLPNLCNLEYPMKDYSKKEQAKLRSLVPSNCDVYSSNIVKVVPITE